MTIHLADGRNTFINFREKAPLARARTCSWTQTAIPLAIRALNGYLAAGVPGTVMGLETARANTAPCRAPRSWRRRSSLPQEGFMLDQGDVDVLGRPPTDFRADPNVAAIFLNHGVPFKVGERAGAEESGSDVARHQRRRRGRLLPRRRSPRPWPSRSQAQWRPADRRRISTSTTRSTEVRAGACHYRGYTVLSAPPPSSGGVILCEMLQRAWRAIR